MGVILIKARDGTEQRVLPEIRMDFGVYVGQFGSAASVGAVRLS